MEDTAFKARFEAFVPRALQTAFDYVNGSDLVETIWIVCSRDGDWSTGGAVYRMGGQIVTPYDVVKVDPTLDNSVDNQMTLQSIAAGARDLLLDGDRGNAPTRIVVRYDVAKQTMNADFYYEPLRMGPDDTLSEVKQAWVERLQQTGNDSAAA